MYIRHKKKHNDEILPFSSSLITLIKNVLNILFLMHSTVHETETWR